MAAFVFFLPIQFVVETYRFIEEIFNIRAKTRDFELLEEKIVLLGDLIVKNIYILRLSIKKCFLVSMYVPPTINSRYEFVVTIFFLRFL